MKNRPENTTLQTSNSNDNSNENAVWATPDIVVVGVCVMPSGYRVGDHRRFVLTSSHLL